MTFEDVRRVIESMRGARARARELTMSTSLEELGLDSLDVGEAFVALEEQVGRRLQPPTAGDIESLGDLVRLQPAFDT